MTTSRTAGLKTFLAGVDARNPGQTEYLQAVEDVLADVWSMAQDSRSYQRDEILRRLVEPDQVISFRIVWEDDEGRRRVERGWRVQHSNAIGPYKGGLRFAGDLTESVLKFLAFEQTFKNSLTGLPLGGGKGGATFNPRDKSDDEVMRFCQSFMTELWRHIGPSQDVPAGDMGVGAREIGFLFGQYKRLTHQFEGALTGKGLAYGGSEIRTEATGYGAVIFLQAMLERRDESLDGKAVAISGSGNVALHAAEKVLACGGRVVSLSDTAGILHAPEGFNEDQLARIKSLKLDDRGRLAEATERGSIEFHKNRSPWRLPCDIAMPCATQNELDLDDAKALIDAGVLCVVEGANMPCTPSAVAALRHSKVQFAPAKAANAGGVAVSGLEMAQNAGRMAWTQERMIDLLETTMRDIHQRCVDDGKTRSGVDYAKGANIAGFRKVADAMVAYGLV